MTEGTPAALRVCYFNRSYWPDTGATGQLLTELAEDLVSVHGMDVTVITGYPLAQNGHAVAASETAQRRAHPARARHHVLAAIASPAGRPTTSPISCRRCGSALRLPRQDVTVALTDPPIIGLAALAARPRRGMVFFCQDIFPEVAGLLEDFRSPLVNSLLDRVNRFLVRRAARIVALGDTMASRLIHGKGADAAKMTVIHNWADTTAIVPSPKDNAFARAHGLARSVRRAACRQHRVVAESRHGDRRGGDTEVERATSCSCSSATATGGRRSRPRPARAASTTCGSFRSNRAISCGGPTRRATCAWCRSSRDSPATSCRASCIRSSPPGRPYIAAVEPLSEVAAVTERHRCGVLVDAGDAAAPGGGDRPPGRSPHERESMGGRARVAAELFGARSANCRPCAGHRRSGGPAVKRLFDMIVVERRADRVLPGVAADRARRSSSKTAGRCSLRRTVSAATAGCSPPTSSGRWWSMPSGSPARCRPPRTIRASPAWAASFARRRSTSCRSSGTSSAAT